MASRRFSSLRRVTTLPEGSVVGIASAVAAGDAAPTEVVGAAIERLRADTLGVVAHPLYEIAIERAQLADQAVARGDRLGPLHGVPVGVKDLYDMAGQPTAAGSTILAGSIADRTATAVAKLEGAGAIVVAKLTTTYDHCGPLARTVADADILARSIATPDPADVTTRLDAYGDTRSGVRGLRIGWDEAFCTEFVHPDVASASRTAITALASAGAEIVDVEVPLRAEAVEPYYALLCAEIAAAHEAYWPERRSDYTSSFAGILQAADGVSRSDVVRAHEFRIGFRHQIDELFGTVDALITPTAPTNAVPLTPDDDIPFDQNTVGFLTFTWLWNLCGAPAVALPWGLDPDGLPNSVQAIAAPGADPVAIAVAAAAEAAAPDLPAPPNR